MSELGIIFAILAGFWLYDAMQHHLLAQRETAVWMAACFGAVAIGCGIFGAMS